MIRLSTVAILSFFLLSCGHSKNIYHVNEFRSVAATWRTGHKTFSCSDEKEAIQIAGSYIFAALQENKFPTNYEKWGSLADFVPLCIKAEDIDSVFSFKNYIPGGFHEVPCQIDVIFRNGKIFRFCFFDIVFDPAKISCVDCPEHSQNIVTEYKDSCK